MAGPAISLAYKVTVDGKRMTVIDPSTDSREKFIAVINAQFGLGRVEEIHKIWHRGEEKEISQAS